MVFRRLFSFGWIVSGNIFFRPFFLIYLFFFFSICYFVPFFFWLFLYSVNGVLGRAGFAFYGAKTRTWLQYSWTICELELAFTFDFFSSTKIVTQCV